MLSQSFVRFVMGKAQPATPHKSAASECVKGGELPQNAAKMQESVNAEDGQS
ncbi:hypothetical protein P609_21880 [Comamonas thiooxydans]|nr:hypothetical protein P609_21880 [Comamonas thiooxydans]